MNGEDNGQRPGGNRPLRTLTTVVFVLAASWALAWLLGSRAMGPGASDGQHDPVAAVTTTQVIPGETARFLRSPVDRAAAAVAEADEALSSDHPDPAQIHDSLDTARQTLSTLTDFYIPVTAARDALVNAWYDQVAGDEAGRDTQLAEAGVRLSWVVEHGEPAAADAATELLTVLNSLSLRKADRATYTRNLERLCQMSEDRLESTALVLEPTVVASTSATTVATGK